MTEVLANPKNQALSYIQNSLGKVAERNGGENGYFGFWDVRVTKKFYLNNLLLYDVFLGFHLKFQSFIFASMHIVK